MSRYQPWSRPQIAVHFDIHEDCIGVVRVHMVENGLSCITEAHILVQQTGERWWEAEVYRLQGALLVQQGVPDVV
jgi:hypothetical protein